MGIHVSFYVKMSTSTKQVKEDKDITKNTSTSDSSARKLKPSEHKLYTSWTFWFSQKVDKKKKKKKKQQNTKDPKMNNDSGKETTSQQAKNESNQVEQSGSGSEIVSDDSAVPYRENLVNLGSCS